MRKNYNAIEMLSVIFKLLGFAGVLGTAMFVAWWFANIESEYRLVGGIGLLVSGLVSSLWMLVVSELLDVAVDIAKQTRQTVQHLALLRSEMSPPAE